MLDTLQAAKKKSCDNQEPERTRHLRRDQHGAMFVWDLSIDR